MKPIKFPVRYSKLSPACPQCGCKWRIQEGVEPFCTATCGLLWRRREKRTKQEPFGISEQGE